MGFKVPQHWGILGAKISIHDRAKYNIPSFWQRLGIMGSDPFYAVIASKLAT
jgi:hypothetical protein